MYCFIDERPLYLTIASSTDKSRPGLKSSWNLDEM